MVLSRVLTVEGYCVGVMSRGGYVLGTVQEYCLGVMSIGGYVQGTEQDIV